VGRGKSEARNEWEEERVRQGTSGRRKSEARSEWEEERVGRKEWVEEQVGGTSDFHAFLFMLQWLKFQPPFPVTWDGRCTVLYIAVGWHVGRTVGCMATSLAMFRQTTDLMLTVSGVGPSRILGTPCFCNCNTYYGPSTP
jgi:hypothetical protein